MQEGTVVLGGQSYAIKELPARANQAWRKKIDGTLKEILGVLDVIPEMELDLAAGQIRAGDIFNLVKKYSPLLLNRIDELADWVISYSPILEEDRERILDNAYESEMITALLEVLKLAYPFVASALNGLSGLPSKLTSTNSAAASGESGLTK
jgi:hypothetical protein